MAMSSDVRNSIILNVLASILGAASFIIGISAITSEFWIRNTRGRSGLWNACSIGTTFCIAIPIVESWLHAVRAFMVIFIILTFFGNITNIISQWKYSKKVREGSGGIWSIAATFAMIATTVYTSFIIQRNSSELFVYGYGFGAAWGVVGAGYLAGLFNYLSSRFMPDCKE